MPKVLSYLPAIVMRKIGDSLGGISARRLVDLRYELARVFVQHLETMQRDQRRPNRSERRDALQLLACRAADLLEEAEKNLPMLRDEHNTAYFFGAVGIAPSNFSYDYEKLVEAVAKLEQIATTILSVPPIGRGKKTSEYVKGFPSDRLENPGTWARVAFARRIAQIYYNVTEHQPGVGHDQAGPYQRMLVIASSAFKRSYEGIGEPYGRYSQPGLRDQKRACAMVVGSKAV